MWRSRPPWRFLKRHAWGLWAYGSPAGELMSWDNIQTWICLSYFIIWRIVDMINAPVRIHHGVVVISLCFKCSESLRGWGFEIDLDMSSTQFRESHYSCSYDHIESYFSWFMDLPKWVSQACSRTKHVSLGSVGSPSKPAHNPWIRAPRAKGQNADSDAGPSNGTSLCVQIIFQETNGFETTRFHCQTYL